MVSQLENLASQFQSLNEAYKAYVSSKVKKDVYKLYH